MKKILVLILIFTLVNHTLAFTQFNKDDTYLLFINESITKGIMYVKGNTAYIHLTKYSYTDDNKINELLDKKNFIVHVIYNEEVSFNYNYIHKGSLYSDNELLITTFTDYSKVTINNTSICLFNKLNQNTSCTYMVANTIDESASEYISNNLEGIIVSDKTLISFDNKRLFRSKWIDIYTLSSKTYTFILFSGYNRSVIIKKR